MLKLSLFLGRLRETLWLLPSLLVVGSLLLSALTLWIDSSFNTDSFGWTFGGDANAARDVLSAISGSMMTFTAVVFSITIVTLQLASSQFSPRVLRTFLRNRLSQFALGTFIATFVYALSVLRAVRGSVPNLSVTVSLILVMCSIGLFIAFINQVAQSIRVASLLQSLGDETRQRIALLFAPIEQETAVSEVTHKIDAIEDVAQLAAPASASWELHASRQGILVALDLQQLAQIAAEEDGVIDILVSIGDFVPCHAVLARITNIDVSHKVAIENCCPLKRERTMQQDPAFGIRQIVDIGVRALSPGINDPTTAVQALDQLHDILRRLGRSVLASGVVHDDSGMVRVRYRERTWAAFVELSVTEIRRYGADSVQVTRRLRALLEDVAAHVPEIRRNAVRNEISLLDTQVDRVIETPIERAQCLTPDAQGLGGATS